MKNIARNILFQSQKESILSVILNDFFSILKIIWDSDAKVEFKSHLVILTLVQRWKQWRYGLIKPQVPKNIFDAIEHVLINRGGMTDEMQNFYIKRESCKTTEYSYILEIGRLPNVKPEKILEFETDFEESLHRIIKDTNVRVAFRPLRIIIDINTDKHFYLEDSWNKISELDKNTGLCSPGYIIGDKVELYQLNLLNHVGLSVMARSGFGKSQLLLSTLLTLCRLNSPDYLSLIIVDPKERDFPSLERLPHLAHPIIYEYSQALVVMRELMLELERRREQRLPNYKPIVVVFDELADLLDALSKEEQKELQLIIKRLGQKGRSFGIFIIGASQRAYEVPEDIRNKLELKIAGRCNNNNDAYAATGISGLNLTKLNVGEFEIHPNNERLKGFFIADDKKDNYQALISKYVDRTLAAWDGLTSHFSILGKLPSQEEKIISTSEEEFVKYCKQNAITTVTGIIDAHKAKYGKGMGTKKAREYRALILS